MKINVLFSVHKFRASSDRLSLEARAVFTLKICWHHEAALGLCALAHISEDRFLRIRRYISDVSHERENSLELAKFDAAGAAFQVVREQFADDRERLSELAVCVSLC